MSGALPLEPAVQQPLRQLANVIGLVTPPGYGFALLMFPLDVATGGMNYISNARREDMVAALKELAERLEGRAGETAETLQ